MSKSKTQQPKKERPGIQVVLRVPIEVRTLLERMANEAGTSMNSAAIERLATGSSSYGSPGTETP